MKFLAGVESLSQRMRLYEHGFPCEFEGRTVHDETAIVSRRWGTKLLLAAVDDAARGRLRHRSGRTSASRWKAFAGGQMVRGNGDGGDSGSSDGEDGGG